MKNFKIIYWLIVLFLTIGCSGDNESFQPVADNTNAQGNSNPRENIQTPMESLDEMGAVALEGYPKTIKKFEKGKFIYWAQYYFRPDGNILKVNYGHPNSTSETFSYNYQYDANGNILTMAGWDDLVFYYGNGRIIKVEGNNVAWHGRYDLFYEYNDQGQVIQKLEMYYGTTPVFIQKTNYTYLENGNLGSIETYVDSNGSGNFELYTSTNFSEYIEPINLFLELEIIPGQRELLQFPGTREFKHLKSSGYDVYETYGYKYDGYGRVIEKVYENNKVVYEYY